MVQICLSSLNAENKVGSTFLCTERFPDTREANGKGPHKSSGKEDIFNSENS